MVSAKRGASEWKSMINKMIAVEWWATKEWWNYHKSMRWMVKMIESRTEECATESSIKRKKIGTKVMSECILWLWFFFCFVCLFISATFYVILLRQSHTAIRLLIVSLDLFLLSMPLIFFCLFLLHYDLFIYFLLLSYYIIARNTLYPI